MAERSFKKEVEQLRIGAGEEFFAVQGEDLLKRVVLVLDDRGDGGKAPRPMADQNPETSTSAEAAEPAAAPAVAKPGAALAKARKAPEGEVVHDWRKAAKVWWYHMRLYERTAPAIMENLCLRLDELGETLGDHHNLMVLADWIVSTRAPGDSSADTLLTIIAERQAALSEKAFDLGRQFAAERPGVASERFDAYLQLLG